MAMRNCLLVLGLLTGCQAATARLPEVSQAQSTDADSMCLPRQAQLSLSCLFVPGNTYEGRSYGPICVSL